jgi:hypothetical protein
VNDGLSLFTNWTSSKDDFTFDAWRQVTRVGYSQSINSTLLIGLPAGTDAADNDQPYYCALPDHHLIDYITYEAAKHYYVVKPKELTDEYRNYEGFSGVMLWNAGSSDTNVVMNAHIASRSAAAY